LGLPKLLEKKKNIYSNLDDSQHHDLEETVSKTLESFKAEIRRGEKTSYKKMDIDLLIREMRLIKDKNEIDLIKHAVKMSELAHMQVMQHCKPGMNEMDINAILNYVFQTIGHTQELAYPNIVGGGENGCILHYMQNDKEINDNSLVLVDASEEHARYASDITRTFPANGKFTEEQLAIYNIVLKAQKAAIDLVKPGGTWKQIRKVAIDTVTTGLHELGILKGDLAELIAASDKDQLKNPTKQFYLHGLGHYLGLDVHDHADYGVPFAPGMVFTVEPGIYINPERNRDVDKRYHGIGVRIEDDILVTPEGHEVLSGDLPKEPAEVKAAMAGKIPPAMQAIGYKKLNIFSPKAKLPEGDIDLSLLAKSVVAC